MNNSKGFTLIELLIAITIVGVLAAITAPNLGFTNKPLQQATNQTLGILKQARSRAIVTTSIYQVMPTSTNQLSIKTAQARVCAASTQLTNAASNTDTILRVASVNGFAIGDWVLVDSSSTKKSIIATDPDTNTITLDQPLGSAAPINANVKLAISWINDASFSNEDLTLPQGITMSSTSWALCFNSRGIANQYNNAGSVVGSLTVNLADTSGKQNNIQVLQGGAVNANF